MAPKSIREIEKKEQDALASKGVKEISDLAFTAVSQILAMEELLKAADCPNSTKVYAVEGFRCVDGTLMRFHQEDTECDWCAKYDQVMEE